MKKEIFKDSISRKEFFHSKEFNSIQLKIVNCLNSIIAGDSFFSKYLYDEMINMLNKSLFIYEKDYATLSFKDLCPPDEVQSEAQYENSKIDLDERFLKLSKYKETLNEPENWWFSDSNYHMLLRGIINIFHEFTHHIQEKVDLTIDRFGVKKAKQIFSKQTMIASNPSLYRLDLDQSISFDIITTVCKLKKINQLELLKLITDNDKITNSNKSDLLVELIDKIQTIDYQNQIYEKDARFNSYVFTTRFLNSLLLTPNLSEATKDFIEYSLEFLSDNTNLKLFYENHDTYIYMHNNFLKEVINIDNKLLFRDIDEFAKKIPSPLKDLDEEILCNDIYSEAVKYAYFLNRKGVDSIKQFMDHTITEYPSEFNFLVGFLSINTMENTKDIYNKMCSNYFNFIVDRLKENNLKTEQLSSLFLSERRYHELLKYFEANKMTDNYNQLKYIVINDIFPDDTPTM